MMKEHWDSVYKKYDHENLGWYEKNPAPSLELIKKTCLPIDKKIIDIGTGASTLIDELIGAGYSNISVLDISEEALEVLKSRLGENDQGKINFIVGDITDDNTIAELGDYKLWHDRTLLHFLVEDEKRDKYLSALKKSLLVGGYAIIAVFSLEGAKKCSGLAVRNYDHNLLCEFLGNDFELQDHFYHTYIQPSGNERPFVYTLFKRIK